MPIVFRKKCPGCGRYIKSLTRKCPYCGYSLIKVPTLKKGDGVTPHVVLIEREVKRRKKQADLVKDFGFPDVNEEIRKTKEKIKK